VRQIVIILIALTSIPAFASDISVEKVELSYLDNISNPNNPVVRTLESLHDNEYWSKPKQVDAIITIKNTGEKVAKNIKIKVELYYLLSHREDQPNFPALPNELKTITDKPVWVWTNNLVRGGIKELKPGEIQILVYKNLKVRGNYYAYDYSFKAFAVKAFAKPRGVDSNYKNNSNFKIVSYGD